MKLLVSYENSKKVVEVTDKSEVKNAACKAFEEEIRNREVTIQYYMKEFDDFVDLEFANIEDHGKIRLIAQDNIFKGKSS